MCDEGAVWHDSRFNGSYRGQYWGLVTDLQARTVHPERVPLPSQLHKLAERMHALGRQLATRRDTAELATRMTAFQPNEANALEVSWALCVWLLTSWPPAGNLLLQLINYKLSLGTVGAIGSDMSFTLAASCSTQRSEAVC
jgi:hypothetical protein